MFKLLKDEVCITSKNNNTCLPLGEKDKKKDRDSADQRREDQLSHLNLSDDLAPPSPSPAPTTSDGAVSAGALTRENSIMSVSSAATNLPPDTQKFLKFAGELYSICLIRHEVNYEMKFPKLVIFSGD